MKVLLIGEFSSLHKYLKDGLNELGLCEVLLASNGDSWKKIPGADFGLYTTATNSNKIKNIYYTYIKPCILDDRLKNNDVVQFINPKVYSPLINNFIIRRIVKNNNIISLVSAGGDYAVTTAYKNGKFDYYPFDYDKKILDDIYNCKKIKGFLNVYNDKYLVRKADCIIPSVYEYSIGYEGKNNLQKVIPFPINIDDIKYTDNIVKGKIVFFHGLNRELEKGTYFIRVALEKLKERYPDDIEIVMDGQMPFEKYMMTIRKANIVVDQCCSYGYGINACISMAQGKVVVSGCRKETIVASGIDEAPIINAKPDIDYLYKQMCHIVENRHRITEWGYRSRKFIEDYHDYRKIAFEYYQLWTSKLKNRL